MTLSAGSRLGPYEVLAPLGAGGMGEVYRARDTRLEREVAIKVLPAELASDPVRLERFEKEARSASALNHPNIVTIYDIGSDGGVSYIAMERVEGATLRELLAGGGLPVKRLLPVATQIGEGLSKAHEAGIVHRDLKPENVMVTKDGLVKILDFGLAKLTSTMSGSGQGSQLPTMTGTTPGVVVGTVGYVSPEQAGVDGSAAVKVTESTAEALSPDAKWVACVRENPPRILLVPTGAGETRTIVNEGFDEYWQSSNSMRFSPDGRSLFFVGIERGHKGRLYEQNLEGGKPRAISPEEISTAFAVSQDGTLVVVGQPDGFWIYPVAGGER